MRPGAWRRYLAPVLGMCAHAVTLRHREFALNPSVRGVFTPDLLEEYIKYKRVYEVDAIRLRPTPHEFAMYFDC